jgi:hypothetical protein
MSLQTRNGSLDVFKGLLVVMMTYGHVLQFFGDSALFPVEGVYELLINLHVFPGFVFAFGAATALAYYSKPFKTALPRMTRSALKMLGAFYLSGIAFRVLRENKPFASGTIRRILLLQDIPGWSEFLVSFTAIAVLGIVLYWPLKQLRGKPALLLPIGIGLVLLCFLPYEAITQPVLALFVGTTRYASFPALQYFPYFLAGLALVWLKGRGKWTLIAVALVSSLLGLARLLYLGQLPNRFPPDFGWILLPAAGIAILYLLASGLHSLQQSRFPRLQLLRPLISLGSHSLYYLLAGNLVLFTLAGKGIAPLLKFKAPGLFGQPIAAPFGAFLWTVALLLAVAFVASLVGQGKGSALHQLANTNTKS